MALNTGPSEGFLSKFKKANKGKKEDKKDMKKSNSKSKLARHMSKDC